MLKHNFVEGFCQGDFEYVSCGDVGLLKSLDKQNLFTNELK